MENRSRRQAISCCGQTHLRTRPLKGSGLSLEQVVAEEDEEMGTSWEVLVR